MKKMMTILVTVCMLVASVLPTWAVSYDLETVQLGYELGTPTAEYDFAEEEGGFWCYNTNKNKYEATITYNEEYKLNKPETNTTETIDIRKNGMKFTFDQSYALISFQFKTDFDSTVRMTLGEGSDTDYLGLDFQKDGKVKAFHTDATKYTMSENALYDSLNEYITVQILMDGVNDKYSLWIGDKNFLIDEPDFDGLKFQNAYESNGFNYFRLWTSGKTKESKNMYLDNFSMTPLVTKTSLTSGKPSLETKVYELNFDNFTTGAYDANDTIWKNLKSVSAVKDNSSPNKSSSTGDLTIVEDGTSLNKYLQIASSVGKYHQWFFTKDVTYGGYAAPSSSDNVVVQMKIKSNGQAYVRIGAGADSAVPIAILVEKDEFTLLQNSGDNKVVSTTTFVNVDDESTEDVNEFEAADFTTITFLVHETDRLFSLWFNDVCVLRNATYTTSSNALTQFCISYPNTGTTKTYIDDVKIYTAADDDFLKVYNLMNELKAGTKEAVSTADESIVLKNATALGTSATVSYSDSKGYVANGDVKYPLFAIDTTDIRAVVQSGAVKEAKVYQGIPVPKAYTFRETATFIKNGTKYDVSVPVSLRNELSAGRLLVVTAVYDGNECKKVSIKEDAFANYNGGTFDASIELGDTTLSGEERVKVFFWEKGTLTPLKVYGK